MWRTSQKLIPSSSIHAKGSRYLLWGSASFVNPANYFKEGTERDNIFKLVAKAIALKRETRHLESLSENAKCSPRNKEAYLNYVDKSNKVLENYIKQLERDFENEGDLPFETIAGFVSLAAGRGTLTRDYFEQHVKNALLSKIGYASLEGLTEIAEAIEVIGIESSSDAWKAVHQALSKKLEVRDDFTQNNSGYTNVTYAGNSLDLYSVAPDRNCTRWVGSVTATQACPIQSRIVKPSSFGTYNYYM